MISKGLIKNRKELAVVATMVTFTILALIMVLVPEFRSSASSYLKPEYRKIVSTITADILNNGSQFKIVKIKTNNGLLVEVYDTPNKDGLAPLIEKIEIANSRDAFFEFRGNATQLALQDIDGDNRPEILIPSFDSDMVAHIQIFRVSPETHKIELVSN